MVTDSEGNVITQPEFNAYGEITGGGENVSRTSISEVNSNNLSGLENLFVGAYGIKYDGKTNLHYMRYRWYSADQMRFLSPDLLLGINRYAYCNNNPVNFIDYNGVEPYGIATTITVGALSGLGNIPAILIAGGVIITVFSVKQYSKTYQARIYGRDYIPSFSEIKLQAMYAVSKGAYSQKDLNYLIVTLGWYYLNYKNYTDVNCDKAANRAFNDLSRRFYSDSNYPFTFVRTRINYEYPGHPEMFQNPWNVIYIIPKKQAMNIKIDPYDAYNSELIDLDNVIILYPGSDPIEPVIFQK